MSNKTGTTAIALAAMLGSTAVSAADWSANLGWNSEYIFRGIPQKTSSAFGGVDVEAGGFYGGAWAADVGEGLEIDYYGGYGVTLGEFSLGVGATFYTYTDDFDDTYQELNLSAGWNWLSFDVALGEYKNFAGPTLDYEFYSFSAEYNGFYGTVGTFEGDFDGSYYEAGYGGSLFINELDVLDYALTAIYSDSTLLGGQSDTNLVLTLSKSFDF